MIAGQKAFTGHMVTEGSEKIVRDASCFTHPVSGHEDGGFSRRRFLHLNELFIMHISMN